MSSSRPDYFTVPIIAIGTRELIRIPLPPEFQDADPKKEPLIWWKDYLVLVQAVAEMVPVGVLDDVLDEERGERSIPALSRQEAYLQWLMEEGDNSWWGFLLWMRCAHEHIAETRDGAGWVWKKGELPEGEEDSAVAWMARNVRDEQVLETRGLLIQFWGPNRDNKRALEVYRQCLSAVYRVLCQQ